MVHELFYMYIDSFENVEKNKKSFSTNRPAALEIN